MTVSRNEENVIRVSNLSEGTHEADLRELFSRFGPPTRVYVAIDHKFGLSRGFGYVILSTRKMLRELSISSMEDRKSVV